MGFNGGKTLTRVALDDPGTLNTLTGTATAINELAARGLVAMVEPFWSSRVDGKVRNDLSADAVIKSVGVCSALGRTSAYTWMKLPGRARHGAGDGFHHLPDPAARRRSRHQPGGDLRLLAGRAPAAGGPWPGRRPHAALPG